MIVSSQVFSKFKSSLIELILPTSYRIVQQYPRSYRFVIDSSTAVQLLYAGRHVELDKSLLLQESLDIELDKY